MRLLPGSGNPDFLRTREIFAYERQIAVLRDGKRGRHGFGKPDVFATAGGSIASNPGQNRVFMDAVNSSSEVGPDELA